MYSIHQKWGAVGAAVSQPSCSELANSKPGMCNCTTQAGTLSASSLRQVAFIPLAAIPPFLTT